MGVTRAPRIICSVWGEPKTGKTHFALTFPQPIAAIEVGETGLEDALYLTAFKDADIRYEPLIIDKYEPTVVDHANLLVRFERTMDKYIGEFKDGGTIVIDSTSRLLRSIRIVKTQEAHEISQRQKSNRADYELANDYFEQILQVARKNSLLNVVLVHRHREKFAMLPDDAGRLTLQATGVIEARDYTGLENLAPLVIQTQLIDKVHPQTKKASKVFQHIIQLCRYRPGLQDRRVDNLSYSKLLELIMAPEEE